MFRPFRAVDPLRKLVQVTLVTASPFVLRLALSCGCATASCYPTWVAGRLWLSYGTLLARVRLGLGGFRICGEGVRDSAVPLNRWIPPGPEVAMGPTHVENVMDLACRTALAYHGVSHVTVPVDFQEKDVEDWKRSKRNIPHHTSSVHSHTIKVRGAPA